MEKMIIGITCSEKRDLDRPSQATNEAYIEAVIKAGAVPILLPMSEAIDMIASQVKCIDGLLITGGIDVNPLLYKESCQFLQGESNTRRDYYEVMLIHQCVNSQIPILGICRGLQIINVAFGGTLYQDNSFASEYVQQHVQKERKEYPIHSIRIKKDSFLYSIFGEKAYVNSFHHQSIKKTAEGFRVIARSEDSIIEAIEHNKFHIRAVQFHPEMMHNKDENMQKIFNEFIKMCQNIKLEKIE